MNSQSKEYVTVDEYFLLEDAAPGKHEYVDGKVLAMAGATREHNEIVSNIIHGVRSVLKEKNCGVYPSDYRVTNSARKNYFYPDATVVCGDVEEQPDVFDTLTNPLIIFEVMREGTENIDRGYKFFFYQQIPSLLEYVLIDSREYTIEIIRRQADGVWKFERFTQADKYIHLTSINCTLSFSDVYYRVNLLKSE